MILQSFRQALRRYAAHRIRVRSGDIWPIKAGTEQRPGNWPGWPEGKQFAFVLTHDVDDQRGLDQCEKVVELEEHYGFRSAFNFVSEGNYVVPTALREDMTRRGFEVAVHDLCHDGPSFRSRHDSRAQAKWTKPNFEQCKAPGFRAGLRRHNLRGQQNLKGRYVASTSDVDPFDFGAEGANTIFPFWVQGDEVDSNGYVELPFTLAHDSTLFLLLGERTIDVWKQKLKWVAEHGGMVSLNVHPDYMTFDNQHGTWDRYAVGLYAELLEYVRTSYAGKYWQALPGDVAEYCAVCKPHRPSPPRKRKRICMITHSYYERDNRVIRYAEALAQRGDTVDIYALRAGPGLPKEETINGVKLIRVQDRFGKETQAKWAYVTPLVRFLLTTMWQVARRHWRYPYQLVHAHNIPDFVVFAALVPRLSGAKVVLDIHDIVPEFFGSKFRVAESSLLVRALKILERVSAGFADHVILANHLWLDRYTARSASHDKCSVFINNVDNAMFRPAPRDQPTDRQVTLFPGGLQWHQGVDIAIRAFGKLRRRLPKAEFHIYGDGNMKVELQKLVRELELGGCVRFFEPLPAREIALLMAQADLGVVPKRADSFGNEAYSTKIMEFMAVGVPVVVSSTRIDRYYFDDSVVRFFESGNADALAKAMYEVLCNEMVRNKMIARASVYAAEHSWERRKHDYLLLVDSLCSKG